MNYFCNSEKIELKEWETLTSEFFKEEVDDFFLKGGKGFK